METQALFPSSLNAFVAPCHFLCPPKMPKPSSGGSRGWCCGSVANGVMKGLCGQRLGSAAGSQGRGRGLWPVLFAAVE